MMLGGGGLVAVNVYASASENGSESARTADGWARVLAAGAATIYCPDIGTELTDVPDAARADVDGELAQLDGQIADAYQRLRSSSQALQQDSGFADSAIMNPLKEKRAATIDRIATAIDRVGDRPEGLESLAGCELRDSGNRSGEGQGDSGNGDGQEGNGDGQDGNGAGQDQGGDGQNDNGQNDNGNGQNGNGAQGGNGPVAADFADITTVQPNVQNPRPRADASRGSFTTKCGVNANGLFNSDNVIVAPGVTNGAHHFHDYVGNQANNAFASDDDLANADTSCENQGDKSTYYWPVLRLQNGTQERDAGAPGGGTEGNAGKIVTPKQVTLTFVGNPRGKVTAMPRLLRIITGDAKAFVNGTANANASWSCTGFEDRQLKDKYPICPDGSDVVRSFKFQSCWDGQNIDSANHRTHVAFADAEGNCANGFKAIPQLVQRIVYDVDAPSLQDGGRTSPLFAVDAFPEQLHKPVTDHGDFINVFDEGLMQSMVDCINSGRQCDSKDGSGSGSGSGDGSGSGSGDGSGDGSGSGSGSGSGGDEPQGTPTPTPAAPSEGSGTGDDGDTGGKNTPEPTTEAPSTEAPNTEAPNTDAPSAEAPSTEPAEVGTPTGRSEQPKVYTTSSSSSSSSHSSSHASPSPQSTAVAAGGNVPSAEGSTEPQAVTGGLADTGTNLWPAAAGGTLLIAGTVLLLRIRRRTV